MAGIGQEAVTPIRPDLLTSQIQPLQLGVQQNAVAQLSDAFRQGVITSDDIIARYGDLAKTKQRAEIQGLEELISPTAIAQRKQHAALMSEKEKSELALLPAAEAAKLSELQQLKVKADQGDRAAMREYAIKHGFGTLLSQVAPGASYTMEQADKDAQVYQDAVRYAQAVKAAQDTLKDINPVPNVRTFKDDSGESSETDYENPILTSGTGKHTYTQDQSVKASSLANMTPQEWVAAGRPTSGEYIFGAKPVEKPAAAVQDPVQKVTEVVTPGKTIEVEERKANGDVKITRTVIEPTEHPNVPKSIQELKPGQTFKAAPENKKVATGEQQRAQLGLDRFEEAAQLTEELKALGYNPAGTWNSATSWLPGPTKPETRQKFELAKKAFSQGLLRLESGAAITVSENKDYATVFFPKWGDTPAVMQAKEQLRNDIAATAAEIATAGGVASPDIKAKADKIRERAKQIAPAEGTSTQLGRPTTLTTGKSIVKDPKTGQWFEIKNAGPYPVQK